VTETSPSLSPKTKPINPERPFLTFIFRLLVLGIGMGAAIIVGVIGAMWQPVLIWQPDPAALSPKKQVFTLSSDALFEPDRATILPDGYKLLDRIAAQLPLSTGKSIRIGGHTDISVSGENTGATTASKPLDISYQRALAVRDYLIKLRGENAYSWIAVGYGSSRPIAANDSDTNRKSNRRIEIVISD
jgi:outer membrane protein OmpA-like peptidoglycan-associated protein